MISSATSARLTSSSDRWQALAAASPLAVLLDFDGTLVNFAATPELAVLDDELGRLLNSLVEREVQVVIVSGRAKDSIDGMRTRVPGAWWVAEHGTWRWDHQLALQPNAHAPQLEGLAAKLAELLATPGTRVERKSLSLCVHWRLVDETVRAALAGAIATACDEWLEEQPSFERIEGVEMLEVRQRDINKGDAVRWVRDRLRGVRIIAVGDDVTDEDMFAELDDGDASVSVGPRVTAADAHARGVDEVRAFLRWLADARGGTAGALPLEVAEVAAPRKRHRLLVMSNRTPALGQGRSREVGGLVSALEPALRDERGIWLGWSGQERSHVSRVTVDASELPVRARFDLPTADRQSFYAGFCNSVLWPLFHGFPSRVRYTDGDFDAYVRANARYARHALELAQGDATIWVHDYHLLVAARAMRELGHRGRIGLFLHVPFPAPVLLEQVPWSADLVDAMLDFDLLGFQTQEHARNFLAAADGARSARKRVVDVGVFPATIDPEPFRAQREELSEVAGLRAALGDRKLIVGVDRLDYSKGIPERLAGYEQLLEKHPRWRRRVTFLQISVPTRAEIPDYAELREQVERLVGRINGRFGDTDWVPVRYLYRSYEHAVLAQLYRLADVALVTPLCDGMNLVAKEFIASQDPTAPGVLVLSRFAGAAEALTEAVLTDPYSQDALAGDLQRALEMPAAERLRRHNELLAALEREGDAKLWARRMLDRLAPRHQPAG